MIQLGPLALNGDMAWTDEFGWLPTSQSVEPASNGSLFIEESVQLAGRPITLAGGRDDAGRWWGINNRATVLAARALAAEPLASPLSLQLTDGRVFNVRFRLGELAVEATPIRHIVPHLDGDWYQLTLRLLEV